MALGGRREGAGRKPGKVSAAKRELAEMAKDHAERALAVLVQIMEDSAEPGATRAGAATAILDRAYGKPRQMIEGPGPNGEHMHKVSPDEAFARLASRLAGSAPGSATGDPEAE